MKESLKKSVAASKEAGKVMTFTVNGVSFTMVSVEGGTFMMGATPERGDDDPDEDESPAHSVSLDSFYIGQTPVTQELWEAVMGNNRSRFKGDKKPVESVSWNDCQFFIRKLNRLTGEQFRLPTEAEWEFAARGGNQSKGYRYSGSDHLDDVAWYEDNAYLVGADSPDYGTHDVAAKCPNELGIHDMSGNVYEWCNDWYDGDYYEDSPHSNPQGPSGGSDCVFRGGSWYDGARYCRVSYRYCYAPDDRLKYLGLRLAF